VNASPLLLIAGAAGVGLAWSGITGQSFTGELRRAFTSPSSTRPPAARRPIVAADPGELPAGLGSSGGFYSGDTGSDGGGGGGFGSHLTYPSSTGTGGGPCAALPVPATLVSIGQGSHRLAPAAAAALAAAERTAGFVIKVTDTFRSYAQQADCHARKPDLCAAPGGSCHEKGLAIDVVDMKNQRVIDALTAAGWVRYDPNREPWHWSFGVRG
jgi:hypothetical protein